MTTGATNILNISSGGVNQDKKCCLHFDLVIVRCVDVQEESENKGDSCSAGYRKLALAHQNKSSEKKK